MLITISETSHLQRLVQWVIINYSFIKYNTMRSWKMELDDDLDQEETISNNKN